MILASRFTSSLLLSLGFALILSSCSSVPGGTGGRNVKRGKSPVKYQSTTASDVAQSPAGSGTQIENHDYSEIQGYYAKGAFESVILKATQFAKKYPSSSFTPQVENMHGLSLLLTARALQAVPHFKLSIERAPNLQFKSFILFNLASAHLDSIQLEETLQTLLQISPELLDKDTRIKYHVLKSRTHQKLAQRPEALKEYYFLSKLVEESVFKTQFQSSFETLLQEIQDPVALESQLSEYEDTPLHEHVLYRVGILYVTQGKNNLGAHHLRTLLSKYPSSLKNSQAEQMLKSQEAHTVVEAQKIGVLLPLKGKFGKFANRSLMGIQLAFSLFEKDPTLSEYTLVIEDSGEDAESALRAFNKLYDEHHVIAVIGPLLSKGIDMITARAQELGIPLLNLSQQTGAGGDFVLNLGMTAQSQAQTIARYATQELGMKRFAILAPKDKFGEQYTDAYWTAVEELGGSIVGFETYTAGETDFRIPLEKISGLYYTDARSREMDALAKERELQNIKKRTRKTEHLFAIKPVIDFEAVFIPDEPKVVGQILPTFDYKDIHGVKFLGISTWNSPDLVTRAQKYCEGALFVDAMAPESRKPQVQNFQARFKNVFGNDPGNLEAIAFDAAQLLGRAIKSGGIAASNRLELKERLTRFTTFEGVTGKISLENGAVVRTLSLLTVKDGKIVEPKN